MRDHSNIARAVIAIGVEGWREIDELIVKQAVALSSGDPSVLSSDTTVQEPQIGYPNEPGILRGVAQRVYRALKKMGRRGVEGIEAGSEKAKDIFRLVKHHHLFAKGPEEKQKVLQQLIVKTKELMGECGQIVNQAGSAANRVVRSGSEKLKQMMAFCASLLPQILHWLQTGTVATGKLLHAGVSEARAIVRNKAGKRVGFGFKWLIHRIGGGYIFGKRVAAQADENKMQIEAVKDYREVFGAQATPELIAYDRGGCAKTTIKELQKPGVEKVGIVPKGKTKWPVAEEDQQEMMSQRGQTEGKYPQPSIATGSAGGEREATKQWRPPARRAMVPLNLNKLMRDVVSREKKAQI